MVVAKVSYEPPMIIGFAKSAMDSMKVTRKAFPIPGSRSGRVTLVKTFILEAPMSLAASSRDGSMFLRSPLNIM